MDELERLKLERDRLRAQDDADRQVDLYEQEKKDLKRDIFKRKHKKVIRVVSGVGSVAKRSVGGVGMIFGAMGRSAKPHVVRGLNNLAENSRERSGESRTPIRRKRKVRVVKRRSKAKPKRKVKVVRRRARSKPREVRPRSNIPSFGNFFN